MASKRQPSTVAESPSVADAAALRARIAELEAREAEHARAEKVQSALYRIAEAASSATDLEAFYREVHAIVGELMFADNFYIALYDAERGRMNYPYYVDALDDDPPDPKTWEPFGEGQARGITAYALRLGKPLRLDSPSFRKLQAAGEVEQLGVVTKDGTWLGVPLSSEGTNLGLLVVQGYTASERYADGDLDLLAFVGQHIGAALTRVRAIEETRQRNAELSLVNEIGTALAKQLDFDSVIQLMRASRSIANHASSAPGSRRRCSRRTARSGWGTRPSSRRPARSTSAERIRNRGSASRSWPATARSVP